MIEVKFNESISLFVAKVSMEGAPLGELPIPVYTEEIDDCIAVLNTIEEDHRTDVDRNCAYLPGHPSGRWKPEHETRNNRFQRRELYRLVAYLMYATTLSGVVRTAYDDGVEKLEGCCAADAAALRSRHEFEIERLNQLISPATKVRHKVFAHTAFAKPRKEDSLSQQYTSLHYLCGAGMALTTEGIKFGAGRFIFDGEPAPDLPAWGVRDCARMIAEYLSGWHGLFVDVAASISARTDAEILNAIAYAVAVRRRDRPAR